MQLMNGLRALGVCLVVGILTACGGGGGSGGGDRPPGDPGDPGGPSDPSGRRPTGPGTISGVAHDGPIAGATINVYAWDGQRGQMLASTTTDSTGQYALRLSVPRQSLLIESVGGVYIEETTESNVIIPSGQALFAVQNYDPGQQLTSHITYYSTLAAGLAENLVRRGSPVAEAVTTANTRIANLLGVDLSRPPAVVNNPMGLAAEAAASVELGFATAAVSSLTESMSIANDTQPHTVINSIGFIQAAYDDIRTDGMLNGRGTNGPVALGKITLTPDTYRRQLALNILKAASNAKANRLQVSPTQLVAVATRLNNSTDPIFANAPVTPIDTDKPNIVDLSISEGDVLFGRGRKITFSVQSLAGLRSVQLLLGEDVVIDMADPNAMAATLDTTVFADGQFDLTFVATDAAGVSARRTFRVTLNNLTALMVSNTLKDNQFCNGVFDALFSISDPKGISRVEFLVDGVVQQTQATTEAPFRFDTRKFADGPHTVAVQVTNVEGEVRPGTPISINIDNTPPEATLSLADGTALADSTLGGTRGFLSLSIVATDAVFNVLRLPDVSNATEFLLDGKPSPIQPTNISVAGNSVTFTYSLDQLEPEEGSITSIPDGLRTFSFIVSDSINSMAISTRFTLDRTPPVVRVASPTNCVISSNEGVDNQCQVFSGIVPFRGTIVDAVSTVSPMVKLTLTGRDEDTGSFTAPLPGVPVFDLTLSPDSSFAFDFDTRTLPSSVMSNDLVGYVITSTDAAGNIAGRFGPTGVFRVSR